MKPDLTLTQFTNNLILGTKICMIFHDLLILRELRVNCVKKSAWTLAVIWKYSWIRMNIKKLKDLKSENHNCIHESKQSLVSNFYIKEVFRHAILQLIGRV